MHDEDGDAQLYGTHQQQLIFLNTRWEANYSFRLPQAPGGKWTAVAKFGAQDELQAFSPSELLEEVRVDFRTRRLQNSKGDESLNGQPGGAP